MLADLIFKNNTQIDWSLLLLTLGCSFCFLSLFFSCPTRVTGLFITRCLSECVEAPPYDRWFMGTPIELSVLSQVSRNWHSAWVKKKIVTSLWNTARWWPCWSQDPSYWHKSAFLGSQWNLIKSKLKSHWRLMMCTHDSDDSHFWGWAPQYIEVIDYKSNIRVSNKWMSMVMMRENVQRILNM